MDEEEEGEGKTMRKEMEGKLLEGGKVRTAGREGARKAKGDEMERDRNKVY